MPMVSPASGCGMSFIVNSSNIRWIIGPYDGLVKAWNAEGVDEPLVLFAKKPWGGKIAHDPGHKWAGYLGPFLQGPAINFRHEQARRTKRARHAGQHETDG